MINVKPFKGLRANIKESEDIVSYPYDVLSLNDVKNIIKKNPLSFYRISRSEAEFENNINPYSNEVYEKAKSNFTDFINKGHLVKESKPCFYLYRQILNNYSQTGIIANVNVQNFTDNTVKKHENTLVEKENDRIRHIDTLNAQTGPVFLIYKDKPDLNEIIMNTEKNKPEYDFITEDNVKHTFWIISDDKIIQNIIKEFAAIDYLYIADGHHRASAARQVAQKRKINEEKESDYIMSIIYPQSSLRIMAYNRAVKDLNGNTKTEFIDKIKNNFDVEQAVSNAKDGGYIPKNKNEFGMYIDNQWYKLVPKANIINADDPVLSLDVSILQNYILDQILGIVNPRTDKRIDFFGGNKDTGYLKKVVDNKDYIVAFSLYPTSINELIKVADAGLLMPPKSTWFDPKPRSGFVIHQLD